MNEQLQQKLNDLPDKSGVYRFLNQEGNIIYVGKATSLKSRVRSYFIGTHNTKTQVLVSHVEDLEFTITDNSVEALLLENTLIKKHKPKYNILLKDDKTYPYLQFTKESYPRLIVTRRFIQGEGRFFGPYSSDSMAYAICETLNEIFPFVKQKNCGKREPCLYYHTHHCLAPCFFQIESVKYQAMIQEASQFLKGNTKELCLHLEKKMQQFSENKMFEAAAHIRDQWFMLKKMDKEQKMISTRNESFDVLGSATKQGYRCYYVLMIRKGVVFDFYQSIQPDENEYGWNSFIEQYYFEKKDVPKHLVLSEFVYSDLYQWKNITPIYPKRGIKHKLLLLAQKNADKQLDVYLNRKEQKEKQSQTALCELQEILHLESIERIDMFDNSNLSGTNAVSAMVSFIDGFPAKSQYRKFRIERNTPDDVATMHEVVQRHYKKALERPDVLLIDGGETQTSAAEQALSELQIALPVFGVKKDDRHRTAVIVDSKGREYPFMDKKQAFYLVTRIQDEVHRFALNFHQTVRRKQSTQSVLDTIPGIGKKRKLLLLQQFKTIEAIQKASMDDFKKIGIPQKVAENIQKGVKNG